MASEDTRLDDIEGTVSCVTFRVTMKVVTNLHTFVWNVECMRGHLKVDGLTSKLVTCPNSMCCVTHISIGNLQYLPYNNIVLIHC